LIERFKLKMVIPNVPEESEVKNIIDKLANFVARNGLEFENMTKNKQKNNPKFSFLFGGKYFAYYKYKLASEQQMLNPQNSNLPDVGSHGNQWNQMNFTPFNQAPTMNNLPVIPPWQQQPPPNFLPNNQPPIPPNPSVNHPPRPFMMTSHPGMPNDQLDDEEYMKQQIRESEMNLQQQYESLTAQEEARVDDVIYELDEKDSLQRAGEAGINLNQLEHLLQPVIDSCTKDSIASCKQWILNNSISPFHSSIICKLILNRVVTASRKARKQRQDINMNLHLVYLLHDVIHHAARRNIDHLMMAIEHVITPIYCITFINSEAQDRDKLSKLLDLWEEQKYFQNKIINGIRKPENTFNEYQMERSSFHAETIRNIKHEFQSKFEKYKHQHQEYCDHLQHQINEKRQFFDNRRLPNKPPPMRDHFNESADNNFQGDGPAKFQPPLNEPWMTSSSRADRHHENFPPRQDSYTEPQQPDFAPTAPSGGGNNTQKSSPTAPIAPVTSSDDALKPKAPYYDLPAGLMAPLVPVNDLELHLLTTFSFSFTYSSLKWNTKSLILISSGFLLPFLLMIDFSLLLKLFIFLHHTATLVTLTVGRQTDYSSFFALKRAQNAIWNSDSDDHQVFHRSHLQVEADQIHRFRHEIVEIPTTISHHHQGNRLINLHLLLIVRKDVAASLAMSHRLDHVDSHLLSRRMKDGIIEALR